MLVLLFDLIISNAWSTLAYYIQLFEKFYGKYKLITSVISKYFQQQCSSQPKKKKKQKTVMRYLLLEDAYEALLI